MDAQRFEKEVSIIDGVTIGNSSDQWLRHYSSNDKRNRVEPLIRHLAFLGVDESGFKAIIQTLREHHVVELDSLSVSVALEAAEAGIHEASIIHLPECEAALRNH